MTSPTPKTIRHIAIKTKDIAAAAAKFDPPSPILDSNINGRMFSWVPTTAHLDD